MLTIVVPGEELYDEENEEFTRTDDTVLQLEHSLVSLSKWESKYEIPFLGPGEKTTEQVLDYIYSMILTPDAPEDIVFKFSKENIEEINRYIESKMTATWFNEVELSTKSKETITSELIYYWMTMFNIPAEYQHWHLNRLFTLIKICNLKNNVKPRKMTRSEITARNRKLNEERRARLGTRG